MLPVIMDPAPLSLLQPDDDPSAYSVSLNEYYKMRHRMLWTCQYLISGQQQDETAVYESYEYESGKLTPEITTSSYQANLKKVVNDNRENAVAELLENGTVLIKESESFNPAGPFGKIPDEDLIRLRHNPCYPAAFTAYFQLNRIVSNIPYVMPKDSNGPPRPSFWSEWNTGQSERIYSRVDSEEQTLFHVSGVQSTLQIITLSISDSLSKIDAETNLVYPSIAVNAVGHPPGRLNLKINGVTIDTQTTLPDIFSSQVEWTYAEERPL